MTPILDPYGDLFRLLTDGGASPDAVDGIRRKLIWAYSWAVPSREVIEEIARHAPLIEMGAGTGYWAWLLSQAGADVLAYDANVAAPPHWFGVREGGPEALSAHSGRALYLCWPPLDEPFAEGCLERYEGQTLLYLGAEGRTAGPGFYARLEREWELVRRLEVPSWPGWENELRTYVRRA